VVAALDRPRMKFPPVAAKAVPPPSTRAVTAPAAKKPSFDERTQLVLSVRLSEVVAVLGAFPFGNVDEEGRGLGTSRQPEGTGLSPTSQENKKLRPHQHGQDVAVVAITGCIDVWTGSPRRVRMSLNPAAD
jgi:hypothetical protein